jgi:drug/metabolite transporter (DMT)-like permease
MADTTPSTPPRFKILAAFLAIYVIWGTTFLGIRIAVETIPAFMMAGLRFTLAGGIMLAALLAGGGRFPRPIHWRSALIVGGLMLAGGIGLLSYAEQRIPSGLAALVVTTIPIWIALFEWLIFRGGRPGLQTFAGLGIGFVGAALLFAPALRGAAGGYDLVGMGIVLLGAMIFALGSLASRRVPVPADSRIGTAAEMLAGGALLLIISLLSGEPARFSAAAVSTRSMLALAYLVAFGSVVGYTAYLWLLKTVDPSIVGTNFYVNPVIAVFVGWLVLDETVTPGMIVAAGVIFLGVAVTSIRLPSRKPAQEGAEQGSG